MDPHFNHGDFVRVRPRNEPGPVVGRVVITRGSEYQVSWVSLGGRLTEMCFSPDEMALVEPVAVPQAAPLPPAIPGGTLGPAPDATAADPEKEALRADVQRLQREVADRGAESPSKPRRRKGR